MRWRPVLSCLLVASCTFELDPLVTDSDVAGGGAAGASGGEDAGCVTLGCGTGASPSGGTGAASGGSAAGGSAGAGFGGGAAGSGGASGGAGGSGAGGSGAGGGVGGTGAVGGGGPTFACINLAQAGCSLTNATACLCEGCNPVFCFDPTDGYPVSDCVCPACWAFDECSNPTYCTNDGLCDPYGEGCNCPDCYDHPLCY